MEKQNGPTTAVGPIHYDVVDPLRPIRLRLDEDEVEEVTLAEVADMEEELKKRKLKAQLTGFGFIPGSDDIPARTALVRQMLHIKGDGTTRLKFLEGACPNLLREMKRYRKKTTTVNGQVFVTDAPQTRGEVHACETLEYLCAYEPKYYPPPRTWGPEPWWVKYLSEKRRREAKSDDDAIYLAPKGAMER